MTRKFTLSLATLIAGALLSGLSSLMPAQADSVPRSMIGQDVSGRVDRVVDGDTLRLEGLSTRIRIWGLDAPEVKDAGGSFATQTLESMVLGGPLVCRVMDIDRYDRIVGQCFTQDGRDVAATMIAAGVAQEYCRFSRNHYRTC